MRCEICLNDSKRVSISLCGVFLRKTFGVTAVCNPCNNRLHGILTTIDNYKYDLHRLKGLFALSKVRRYHNYHGSISTEESATPVCSGCGTQVKRPYLIRIYNRSIYICNDCDGKICSISSSLRNRNSKQHKMNLLSFITKVRLEKLFTT